MGVSDDVADKSVESAPDAVVPRGRTTRQWVWALTAVAVAVVLSAGLNSGAFWRRSARIAGVSVQSGTLDLQVNGADPYTAFTALSLANMWPGNSVAAVLTISNVGSEPLSYYADAGTTNTDGKGLGTALVAKVTGAGTASGTAPATVCGGPALAPSGASFAANLIGTVNSRRELDSGESETVCIQATLPIDAPGTASGGTTAISFVFHGIQVGTP